MSGVLAIWTDIAPELEADFNEWYWREHLPERLSVPGFRQGWRYVAVAGVPRYFTWYALDDVAALISPAYRARLDAPTDWTRRIMPGFRNTTRAIFHPSDVLGAACGAAALSFRFTPIAAERARLDAWLRTTFMPALHSRPGIVRVQLWRAASVKTPPTREAMLRGSGDATVDTALLIEATILTALDGLDDQALASESPLIRLTTAAPAGVRHQLLCGVTASSETHHGSDAPRRARA